MIIVNKTAPIEKLGSKQAVIFRNLMPEIPSTTYATFGLYKYPAKFIHY
jgi:hypothetical protein